MGLDLKVDGNRSLKDQEITLNHTEKHAALKLVAYEKDGTDDNPHDNLATFEDRDIGTVLPPLALAESEDGSDVWVGGKIKKVAFSR